MRFQFVGMALVVLIAVAARGSGPQWTVPPPGEHPRLVFGRWDIPALRARLNESRGRFLFEQVKGYAEWGVLRPGSQCQVARQNLETERTLPPSR